jgi:very-short-patch-repair endonuclease
LAFTLFHGQNRISSKLGVNNWIPFSETEVNSREKFESSFMTDFVNGKLRETTKINENLELENSPSPVKGWQSQTDGVVFSVPRNTNKFISLPYNPKLKDKAKELRQAGNLSEVIMWNMVKNKKLLGLDFDRQKIIGNYIVDFYCANLGLIIEIDGESHDFKGEYDQKREHFLKDLGLEIIHFEDIALKKDSATVGQQLYQACGNLFADLEYQKLPRQSATATPSQAKGNFLETNTLFEDMAQENFIPTKPLEFSLEAKAVFEAGKELWKYYHKEPNCNVNASLYDIREYFQGRNQNAENTRMKNKSTDEKYNLLIDNLRNSLEVLSAKIQSKVYEFGFLK